MSTFAVVFDSCVLYPAPLRDLLMRLALTDLFRAKWTNEIHTEWIRNVLENRPDLTENQLERTRDQMNSHVRDCVVEGYEPLIETLSLPDPNDRHVLAAAIHSCCSAVITYNLKDFPNNILREHGIEAQHPDDFIIDLFNVSPGQVCATVRGTRLSLKSPPKSVDEYLTTLRKQSLHNTVKELEKIKEHI